MLQKLNHIGIAVQNINISKEKYLKRGFKIINKSYDKNFLTDLYLMKNKDEVIELVYTNNPKSNVFNLCSKDKETIYHKCYEVKNIDEAIQKLKEDNYILISDIVYSSLLLGKVCFLYSKENGLIELLEVHK